MGLWATWSSWRCPCSLRWGCARWPLKVLSNPKQSMILWFYDLDELFFHEFPDLPFDSAATLSSRSSTAELPTVGSTCVFWACYLLASLLVYFSSKVHFSISLVILIPCLCIFYTLAFLRLGRPELHGELRQWAHHSFIQWRSNILPFVPYSFLCNS